VHPRNKAGLSQRFSTIPDAEPETGRLIDIAILVGGAIKEIIEETLPRLSLPIVPVKRRMRSERDEHTLSAGTLVATVGFGVH
jgi:hypothetical protein